MPKLKPTAVATPSESKEVQMRKEIADLKTTLSIEAGLKSLAIRDLDVSRQEEKKLQSKITAMRAQSEHDREEAWRRGRREADDSLNKELKSLQQVVGSATSMRDKLQLALTKAEQALAAVQADFGEEIRRNFESTQKERASHAKELHDMELKYKREAAQEDRDKKAREKVRGGYVEYQAMFDTALDARYEFQEEAKSMQRRIILGRDRAQKLQASLHEFCRLHEGVARYRTALNDMAAQITGQLTAAARKIEDAREEASEATSAFKTTAHRTRAFTRVFRSEHEMERLSVIELTHITLLSEPITRLKAHYEEEITRLGRKTQQSDNATMREEYLNGMRAIQPFLSTLIQILAVLTCKREYDILQEVRHSTFAGQQAFMSTWEVDASVKESYKMYSRYMEDHSLAKGTAGQVRLLFREAQTAVTEQKRKEAAYAQGLASKEDSACPAEVERVLDDLIGKSEKRMADALHTLTGRARLPSGTRALRTGSSPSASPVKGFARTSPATRPRTSSPSTAAIIPSGISLASAERKMALLKQQLRSPSPTGRRELEMEWASTRSQVLKIKISNLERKAQGAPERMRDIYYKEAVAIRAELARHDNRPLAPSAIPPPSETGAAAKSSAAGPLSSEDRVTYTPAASGTSNAVPLSTFSIRRGRTVIRRTITRSRAYSTAHRPAHRLHPRAYTNITSRSMHHSPRVTSVTTGSHRPGFVAEGRGTPVTPIRTFRNSFHCFAPMPAAVSDVDSDSFVDIVSESDDSASQSEEVVLTYKISPDDYKKAIVASPNTSAAFWSYRLYKNDDGRPPVVHYCKTYEQAVEQLAKFTGYEVLGFDLEWEPYAQPGKAPAKRCVSLVQLAAEDRIGLFHLALFKGDTTDELIPPALRQILEDPSIAKTGVNVSGDATRLKKCFDVDMQGVFELSHLYRVVKFSESDPRKVNKVLVSLQSQVEETLMLPMAKGEVRTSAWSKALNEQQCTYAASDAYAGLQLYHAHEAKRRAMSPRPPRPAFYELHQPLVMADGTVYVSKSRSKKVVDDTTKPVLDDDDVVDEEFVDAEEELDDYELAPEHPAVNYPELPDMELLSLEDAKTSNARSHAANVKTSTSSDSAATQKAVAANTSPEYAKASAWVSSWRAELPQTHVVKATNHILCVWHIWHHQHMNITDLAQLLRDRPLAQSTVASYIADATSKEGLAFDVERMREVLAIIPSNVHWRYGRVVKQLEEV